MQIQRLFEIIYILLNKEKTTTKELADHFEVSRRTILRDIDTLTLAGIPLYTSQGKGGGISILDTFVLNKTTMSDEEQNQILFALQNLSCAQHTDTTKLLSKLRTLFNKTDTNWIEVDFSRWGNTNSDTDRFEKLKQAILKEQAITFFYVNSSGETTNRTAYPLKLVFKSKSWYLQAYCLVKNDYRIFKINRMVSVMVTPDRFPRETFTPPSMETSECIPTTLAHLELCFASSVAYRIYDEFDSHHITKNENGTFTVIVDLPNDYWLYSFLLSFGTSVKVVKPVEIRNSLLKQAREIQTMYASGET